MSGNTTVPWRTGDHFGIHVYAGDVPVATFHTSMDAAAAVNAHNQALSSLTHGAKRSPLNDDVRDRGQRWFDVIREWEEEPFSTDDDTTRDLADRCMRLADEEQSGLGHDCGRVSRERDAALVRCDGYDRLLVMLNADKSRLVKAYDECAAERDTATAERDRARGLAAALEAENASLTAERDAANEAANTASGPDRWALQEAVRMMWAALEQPPPPPVTDPVPPGFGPGTWTVAP